jgi:protein subunit release factor B
MFFESKMINFGANKEKQKQLYQKMKKLGIYEKDIEEKFILGSGRGGQKVNKTSSCVYLKHLPTNIEVKCQKERSQAINRFIARRRLADKIEAMLEGKKSEEKKKIEKIRRQKRKRSKRAKLKMLEEKRKHSEKKKARQFQPEPEDYD